MDGERLGLGNVLLLTKAVYSLGWKFFIQQVFLECMLRARPSLVTGTQNETNAVLTLRESHLLGKRAQEELVFKMTVASIPALWPL